MIDTIVQIIDQYNGLELKFTATDPVKALDILSNEKTDIIFLDVNMPKISGIQMVEKLRLMYDVIPEIVFITAYQEFAVSGFDLDITDYLLKPISVNRFNQCIEKIKKKLGRKSDHFFIDMNRDKIKLKYDEVYIVEGARNYIYIHTETEKLATKSKITDFEKKLPLDRFIRVHRSYIISKDKIKSYSNNILFISHPKIKKIPIGKNFKENVFNILDLNNYTE